MLSEKSFTEVGLIDGCDSLPRRLYRRFPLAVDASSFRFGFFELVLVRCSRLFTEFPNADEIHFLGPTIHSNFVELDMAGVMNFGSLDPIALPFLGFCDPRWRH